MEKLINLLNEYCGEDEWSETKWTKKHLLEWWLLSLQVISKEYWFIKWLVENDKIDFSLIPNKIKEIWIPMKINWEIKYWFDSSDYYWLLMLLAIQDEPIRFLCEIIK